MTHYHVVLYTDDDNNLIVKQTERTVALKLFTEQGALPIWDIKIDDHQVTVYGAALDDIPTGENKEEIDNLILNELGLIQVSGGLEIHLTVTPSSRIEEFEGAIGVDIVIPATSIAICGIFVWSSHHADLKIYETTLLRGNVKLYIEIFRIAGELADRLAESGVQTLDGIKQVLNQATKQFDHVKLTIK